MSLTEVQKSMDDLQKNMKQIAEDTLKPAILAELEGLSQFENLEAIRWAQYTPYFNDGDECVFGLRGFEYKLVTENDFEGAYSYIQPTDELNSKLVELEEKLDGVTDLLRLAFGDHALVVINVKTKEVTIEEYEHD